MDRKHRIETASTLSVVCLWHQTLRDCNKNVISSTIEGRENGLHSKDQSKHETVCRVCVQNIPGAGMMAI